MKKRTYRHMSRPWQALLGSLSGPAIGSVGHTASMDDIEAQLVEGSEALKRADWDAAAEWFEAAVAAGGSPDAHAGLGEADWWRGDLAGAMRNRERAYAGYRRDQRFAEAFEMGLLLVLDLQGHVGNYAAAAGWLARIERLATDEGLEGTRGWLLLAESGMDIDPVIGEQLALEALEYGREVGDADLELCSLSQAGTHAVRQGRYSDGIGLLDEAMAGSLGGEADSGGTVVFASCNMMVSCIDACDFERAKEWVQAADRFAERVGCPFLYAECRTVYGGILFATGNWPTAETELEAAIVSAEDVVPAFFAQARATLAELRLAQGRLAEATHLVQGVEDHPWAVPVVAQLHMVGGRAGAAESVLHRRISVVGDGHLERSRLEELLGDVEITQSRLRAAAERGEALMDLADRVDSLVVLARANRLLGKAFAASDHHEAAQVHLHKALILFSGLAMTYEVAVTRVALAASLAPEAAHMELQRAIRTLDGLGAQRDADRAARLVRELGKTMGFRGGSRSDGVLTKREEEVLALLAEGMTNPEIAQRLFISRKTVEHHVARVLSKLGVRNRTEAAQHAVHPPRENP